MHRMCLALGFYALVSAAYAESATFRFVWQGAGGYSVQGALAFDSAYLGKDLITGDEISCFAIEGLLEGEVVGRWALGQLSPGETTWRLHFSPAQSAFFVEGQGIGMPQAWNMNGEGVDCGPDGFGLNIGNFAQDICIGGDLIEDSQVSPFQPFPAMRDDGFVFPSDACLGPMVLSALR